MKPRLTFRQILWRAFLWALWIFMSIYPMALSSCSSKPPVAAVSRSMNGTTTTTYHDPNIGFHKALEGFFTP